MNLDNDPTIDDLRALIGGCDDSAGHHILWVTQGGDVRISRLRRDQTPADFAAAHPDMRLRVETFLAGNEYVGPEAGRDDEWLAELLGVLAAEWPKARAGSGVEHIDQL